MTLKVLIIEDDFRIADIHKEMVEQLNFCEVLHTSLNASDAIKFLSSTSILPDIILLDIYIPDVNRLEFLKFLRKEYPCCNIIIASAANDNETVRVAKTIGVFDYLLKPIKQKRLQESFYQFQKEMVFDKEIWTQKELDAIFHKDLSNQGDSFIKGKALPKGIDEITLEKITSTLLTLKKDKVTAQLLAKEIGISRSTARRYLEYLDAENIVEATVHYGQVGRPQRVYQVCKQYEQN
ncbi:MAG TPA: response regulator [Pseudogracilibacillus sp.]|nr:response regulator [Pseudogracilibacillus sp.]